MRYFLFSFFLFCSVLSMGAVASWQPSLVLAATVSSSSTMVIPNDTFWNKQWYLRQIHAPEAWTVATGSHRVIVAVIDGGVDITHPDLQQNIWINDKEIAGDGIDNEHDEYIDDVHGWNFVKNTADVRPVYKSVQLEDTWSHGTLVASLIGARGNDGLGISGVAWNVRLMPLVVLDGNGQGDVNDMMRAIRYAVSHGASIINLSLVGYEYTDELDRLMRNAADAGVVIVAATGNDGDNKEGINLDEIPAYPVCDNGDKNVVIGVSATDTLDQKAPYANYGRSCTDISAPGQELFAARPSYPHNSGRATSTIPGYLDGVTGTSLAAPLVSGVAALIKSVRPEWTVAQIRDRILQTADPIEADVYPGHKGKLGFGRLNAGRALAGLVPIPAPTIASVSVKKKVTRRPPMKRAKILSIYKI
ncbi:hypothetical protein EXS71_04065 [Candidatus Uhrbacteria bacterium]|nr:hypothetical protein [Candidatus Uhrbacteria bacterium]